jgi:hypothetical protein
MQRFCERKEMKLRLIRPYGHKPIGAVLNTVPVNRAKNLIENRVAILVEEKPKKKAKHAKQDNHRAGS